MEDYSTFVRSLKKRLDSAYRLAQTEASKSQSRGKKHYDRKVKGQSLKEGDRVLVRNLSVRGKHKLADLWENDVYLIVDRPNEDIPVYKVKPEIGAGPTRTLHRNLLLPINTIPTVSDLSLGKVKKPKPKEPLDNAVADSLSDSSASDGSPYSSESEVEFYLIPNHPQNRDPEIHNESVDQSAQENMLASQDDPTTVNPESDQSVVNRNSSSPDGFITIDSLGDQSSSTHPSSDTGEITHTPDRATNLSDSASENNSSDRVAEENQEENHTRHSHDVSSHNSVHLEVDSNGHFSHDDNQHIADRSLDHQDTQVENQPHPDPLPPRRQRQRPAWMRTDDYVIDYPPTLYHQSPLNYFDYDYGYYFYPYSPYFPYWHY